jgi:hypothetical protein
MCKAQRVLLLPITSLHMYMYITYSSRKTTKRAALCYRPLALQHCLVFMLYGCMFSHCVIFASQKPHSIVHRTGLVALWAIMQADCNECKMVRSMDTLTRNHWPSGRAVECRRWCLIDSWSSTRCPRKNAGSLFQTSRSGDRVPPTVVYSQLPVIDGTAHVLCQSSQSNQWTKKSN